MTRTTNLTRIRLARLKSLSVSFQVPSNKNGTVPPQAPKLGEVKLINYDFVKYGSSAERTRLLTKWD